MRVRESDRLAHALWQPRERSWCSLRAAESAWTPSLRKFGRWKVRQLIVTGDARDEETARQAIAAAKNTFGRLDILINNTGVGNYKNLVDTSAEEYDEMMDVNVRSTFLFTRHAVPLMLSQAAGTILMISSMAGIYGFGGEAVYCMTKFAQVGFAQALDKELRPNGIKVGVICPGGVKTEFALGKGRTEAERGPVRHAGPGRCCVGSSPRLHAVRQIAHHPDSNAHDGRIARLRLQEPSLKRSVPSSH